MALNLNKIYFLLIRSFPVVCILSILALCFSLFIYILYQNSLPTFDDPTIGFESRNTDLSNRINTWRLLIESTSLNGELSLYPYPIDTKVINTTTVLNDQQKRRQNETLLSNMIADKEQLTTTVKVRKSPRQKSIKRQRNKNKKNQNSQSKNIQNKNPFESKNHNDIQTFFCGKINNDYVQIVIQTNDGSNLLELKSIKNLCYLDQYILRMQHNSFDDSINNNNSNNSIETNIFNEYCESKNLDKCCPSWSLTNFLLLFTNKTDCNELTESDIENFINHIDKCSIYYAKHNLNDDCSNDLNYNNNNNMNNDDDQMNRQKCSDTPIECLNYENLVYNIYNYIFDYQFNDMDKKISDRSYFYEKFYNENSNASKKLLPILKSTNIILPIAKSSKLMSYYEQILSNLRTNNDNNDDDDKFSLNKFLNFFNLSSTSTSNKNSNSFKNLNIVAADFGLKYTLFNQTLIQDLILPSLACLIIFISLLLYTQSTLLTVMTILTNLSSLLSAYFIYTFILNIKFFPFLNLLSLIILVAIGSDNALIYCKTWSCSSHHQKNFRLISTITSSVAMTTTTTAMTTSTKKRYQQPSSTYDYELNQILNHVLMSSFCASFTTCGAFFAGYFSNITSLKCFSIFSALAIITNFFITSIIFPSAIVISDRIIEWQKILFRKYFSNKFSEKLQNKFPNCFKFIFDKIILKLIFNHYYVITLLLTLISLISMIIVIYYPGLQLPVNQEFQIFHSNHLFERYDFEFRNKFWFTRIDQLKSVASNNVKSNELINDNDFQSQQQQLTQSNFVLPIRVVFGLLPDDNGNDLDPFDRGKLKFDENFNISSHESQIWLLEFCREIRSQSFYKPTLGPLLTNCFVETLELWISKRKCSEIIGNDVHNYFPCCELSKFPYEPYVFDYCSLELIQRLHHTPNFIFNTQQAGLRFDSKTGKFKALVIEYDSIFDGFTNSFENITNIWNELNTWIQERIDQAPNGLRNGWFITNNMEFYTLQHTLSTDVIKSLSISVLFAFITLIFTTRHLNLSILSIITISFIIFSSIATLVLLGWKLNIIESIVITLTIGLSIDATLHYTIAYKTLTKFQDNRLLGIQMTIARIGSPVAMGTLTTFIAGTIMLLSNILAYIQIGIFLMIISIFSFIYSTLFHMCLLVIFDCTKSFHNLLLSINPIFKCIYLRKLLPSPSSSTSSSPSLPTNFKTHNYNNNINYNNNNIYLNSNNNLCSINEFESSTISTMTTTLPRSSINSVCLRVTSI